MRVFSQPILSGRTALITGVSRRRGIGLAIARRLTELGTDLFIHSWSPHDREQPWGSDADPDDIAHELRSGGRRIEHLALDFADPSSPARLMTAATSAFGHVDVLILNHARSSSESVDELTADELDLSFQVNCRATLLLIKEWAAQHNGSEGGRVIILIAGQHLGPMSSEIPHALSKGALHQITQTLASHLAPLGITVNSVNPGPTDTGWADKRRHSAVLERMPFGRWGQPEDAARLIGWLATDEAQWVTGQVINSEGGFDR